MNRFRDLFSRNCETESWHHPGLATHQYRNTGIPNALVAIENLPIFRGSRQSQFSWKRLFVSNPHQRLRRQACPPFSSTRFNNTAAAACLHACTKSMRSSSFQITRLECTFHIRDPGIYSQSKSIRRDNVLV
jgi:hypothetical protein